LGWFHVFSVTSYNEKQLVYLLDSKLSASPYCSSHAKTANNVINR
jgi:hypothetical protein